MKKSIIITLLLFIFLPSIPYAQDRIKLATTTSTENSGLLSALHSVFEAEFNIKIDVIAVGTGKALRLGENGDVDVVLVHDPEAEIKFVKEGYGVKRLPVMHNDFILVGPDNDPAGIKKATGIIDAFQRIYNLKHPFISRGDDSGTHKMELTLWNNAGLKPAGDWYLSTGQGMGAVLKIADDKLAYTLTDRGTYFAYRPKIDLAIVHSGAPELFNPYHVIMVNPQIHPYVKKEVAQNYIDFLQGERGQKIISEYKVNGEQLFYPDVIE